MEDLLKWYFSATSQRNSSVSETRDIFEARAQKIFHSLLNNGFSESDSSLIYSLIGEIGNNCFDHNLGFWSDQPGCYLHFEFDSKGIVVALADRGRGMFASLKRVLPDLNSHQEGIETAFQRVVSGRSPEQRGNGLKFVRQIINGNSARGLIARSGTGALCFGGQKDWIELTKKQLDQLNSVGTLILIRWVHS